MSIARWGYWFFVGSIFACIAVWAFVPQLNVYGETYLVLIALGLIGLALWLFFSLERIKLWFKQRSTQFLLSLSVMALMSCVILGGINWIAVVQNKKIDLTVNKLHTLSDQTQGILKTLENPVRIRVWTTNLEAFSPNIDFKGMLENYRTAAPDKIEVEVKNPNEFITEANEDQIKRNNIIIVRELKSGRESRIESFSDSKGEEQVTNAIINATKGRKKQICFVVGYGQASLENREPQGLSFLKESLKGSNYDTQEIVLSNLESIPHECELLANVGPRNAPVDRDMKMISNYLSRGGRMLLLAGPRSPLAWKSQFKDWGVQVRQDMVLDRMRRDNPILVQTQNYSREIGVTEGFSAITIFPEASSISVTEEPADGMIIKTIVSSEAHTYTKSGDINTIKNIRPGAGDMQGPLPLGVYLEKSLVDEAEVSPEKPSSDEQTSIQWNNWSLITSANAQEMDELIEDAAANAEKVAGPNSKVIIFSNDLFVVNGVIGQGGNMDLFVNSVNFLLGDDALMGIRPRDLRQTFLRVTPQDMRMVVGFFLIAAGLFLVFGIKAARRKSAMA